MAWPTLLYLIPYFVSVIISSGVGFYAWQHRKVAGATPLAWVAWAEASWTLGYIFELVSPGLEAKIFWDNTQFLGGFVSPLALLGFVWQYTGSHLPHPRRTFSLLAVPFLGASLLILTDHLHGLIRPAVWLVPGEPFSELAYGFTPTVWLITLYAYSLILFSLFTLVAKLVRPHRLYRLQVGIITLGGLVPMLGVLLTLVGINLTFHRDTTPFTFALSNIIIGWGLFRYRLLDLAPVARDVLIESMGDAMIALDIQGRLVDLNPAAQVLIGQPAITLIGKPVGQVFSNWPTLVEVAQNTTEARVRLAPDEKGESQRHFDLRVSPLRDRSNHFVGRLLVMRDITELVRVEVELQQHREHLAELVKTRTAELTQANEQLKQEITERQQAEQQLSESESRLAQFLDALPVGVIIVDAERKLRYINQWVRQAFEQAEQTVTLGHTWDDVLTRNAISLKLAGSEAAYPPERRPLLRALQGQETTLDDMELVYHQGQRMPLELWTRPIFDEQGQVQYAISAFQDITLRRQTEAALRELNEKLEQRVAARTAELAQETANLTVLQVAVREITTSLELEQVYQAAHRAAEQLMPVDAFVIALLDEASQEVEDVYLFDQGQHWPKARYPLGRGLTSFVITTGQSLHLNDDCHEATKLDTGAELFGTNEDTCSVLALPLRLGDQILGVISAQAYPAYTYTSSHLHLLETLANQISISIANAQLYQQAQQEVVERQQAEEALRQAHDELELRVNQRTAELSQANADLRLEILERRRVEESLRQSEARNQALLNAIPDLILRIRRDGTYLDYKEPRDFSLFATSEQFLGRTLFEVLPAEVAQERMAYLEKALKTEEVQLHEYQLPVQGELRYQEARIVASGVDEVLMIIRDVHERKKAEEQLKASLKEKNLLLQEIHHRVKNNLQVVVSLLKFQSRHTTDPATHDLLQESQNRVRSMALIHEKLYQSPDLAHINFADYVRSLTGYLFRAYRVDPGAYTLTLDVADIFLNIEVGVPCGLIINELVSNSIKHAFPAGSQSSSEIYIGLEVQGQQLKLSVGDNGVGLFADFEAHARRSLGLQLVQMLVEQLEGSLTLESGPKTMFLITFSVP